jgi:hypothetical protein
MGSDSTTKTLNAYNQFDVNTRNHQSTHLVDKQTFNSNVHNVNNHSGATISGNVDNLSGMVNSGSQSFKLMNLQNMQPYE